MGWGFRATCPDCSHEWEGITTSALLGPLPQARDTETVLAAFRCWDCPRCYCGLCLPRAIDRDAWRKWYLNYPFDEGRFPYLESLAARIDAFLSEGNPYAPTLIDLHPGECPRCGVTFEESDGRTTYATCPLCQCRKAILQGISTHYSMEWDDFGFH